MCFVVERILALLLEGLSWDLFVKIVDGYKWEDVGGARALPALIS
jgi:hypothetical protein